MFAKILVHLRLSIAAARFRLRENTIQPVEGVRACDLKTAKIGHEKPAASTYQRPVR